MLAEANRAREALGALTQDLTGFNLESYRRIEGRHTLAELGRWVRSAVLRLGGAAIPDGEFWTFHTPDPLQHRFHLAPRYERLCFDRTLAMRTRNSELGGVGHPLVDALLAVSREPAFAGETARLGDGGTIVARYFVRYENDAGRPATRIVTLKGRADGRVEPVERIEWLGGGVGRGASTQPAAQPAGPPATQPSIEPDIGTVASRFEDVKNSMILDWIPDRYRRARVTSQLVGLHWQ